MGRPILSARFLSSYAANNDGAAYPFPPPSSQVPPPAPVPAAPKSVESLPPPTSSALSKEERVYKWSESPFNPDAHVDTVWEEFLPGSVHAVVPKVEATPETEDMDDHARELLRDISSSPAVSPASTSEAELDNGIEVQSIEESEEEEEVEEDDEDEELEDLPDAETTSDTEEEILPEVDVLELVRRAWPSFVRLQQRETAAPQAQQLPVQPLVISD